MLVGLLASVCFALAHAYSDPMARRGDGRVALSMYVATFLLFFVALAMHMEAEFPASASYAVLFFPLCLAGAFLLFFIVGRIIKFVTRRCCPAWAAASEPATAERTDGQRSRVEPPVGREQRQFSGIAQGLNAPPSYAGVSTANRANAPAGVFSTSL